MERKIRVLVVDDSALMRKLISNIITKDAMIEVADTAMNGLFALKKIKKCQPDIILLDIEMPDMNGLEFLKMKRDLKIDIPVVVLSSLGAKRPEVTMEAIDLGAKDFIIKPSGSISVDLERIEHEIIAAIKKYGGEKYRTPIEEEKLQKEIEQLILPKIQEKTEKKEEIPQILQNYTTKEITLPDTKKKLSAIQMILIGISTGGPAALRQLFSQVHNQRYPILIVQHMPPGFTKEFAKSLGRITSLKVKEAENQDKIEPGWIYIAPGDRHMVIHRQGLDYFIGIIDKHPVNGHKPSVEVLFESALEEKIPVLAIIMTGMGKDGAYAIQKLHNAGNFTIAQSPKDCVVFGMPRVATEIGAIDKILEINQIAEFLNNL